MCGLYTIWQSFDASFVVRCMCLQVLFKCICPSPASQPAKQPANFGFWAHARAISISNLGASCPTRASSPRGRHPQGSVIPKRASSPREHYPQRDIMPNGASSPCELLRRGSIIQGSIIPRGPSSPAFPGEYHRGWLAAHLCATHPKCRSLWMGHGWVAMCPRAIHPCTHCKGLNILRLYCCHTYGF